MVVESVLEQVTERAREEVLQICRMENHRPFTVNGGEYLKGKEAKFKAIISTRRVFPGSPRIGGDSFTLPDAFGNSRTISTTEENLLKVLAAYGVYVSSLKDVMRIHKDEYEAEIEVISHVLAYFDLSSKHLVDNLPKVFETVFAEDFGSQLDEDLAKDLKLVGDGSLAVCTRFCKDEPEIQGKRNEFERQLDILNNAARTVDLFYMS
jgi:hypothetical protein